MVLAAQLRILVKTFVVNMKENKTSAALETAWKEEMDFINELVKKYPAVKWSQGTVEISDCPIGWRPIVDDLFAVLNSLAENGIDYYEVGFVKRITDACNRLFASLRLPRKFRFRYRLAKRNVVKPVIVINQLKEKFAGLRLYYSCDDPRARERISGLLALAEKICSHSCQVSGSSDGKLRTDRWWIIMSDEEYSKLQQNKK